MAHKVTLKQLATYIVRDGARLHQDENTRTILGSDMFVYRVPFKSGGHFDVVVTKAQRDEVWAIIDAATAKAVGF